VFFPPLGVKPTTGYLSLWPIGGESSASRHHGNALRLRLVARMLPDAKQAVPPHS